MSSPSCASDANGCDEICPGVVNDSGECENECRGEGVKESGEDVNNWEDRLCHACEMLALESKPTSPFPGLMSMTEVDEIARLEGLELESKVTSSFLNGSDSDSDSASGCTSNLHLCIRVVP